MLKHEKVSYRSAKVLGKLYRACTGTSSGASEIGSFDRIGNSRPIDDIICGVKYYDPEVDIEARNLLASWNSQIWRMMDTFGVTTEGELVSGQVSKFSVHHSQLRGRREHFALLQRLNRETRELRSEYRGIFFRSLSEHPESDLSVGQIQKACAWYKACKEQNDVYKRSGESCLHSFPWVISDVLGKIISAGLHHHMTSDE